VLAYIVTGPLATNRARYIVYSDFDSTTIYLNQQNFYNAGWQPLTSIYLSAGRHQALKLDNRGVSASQYVVADAAMLLLNRKLSPEVVVTDVASPSTRATTPPPFFDLTQNYPNPFNHQTTFRYYLQQPGTIILTLYNLQSQLCTLLLRVEQSAGWHETTWSAPEHYPTGIYFYQLEFSGPTGRSTTTRKLLLLK
jgi:hypothetical protein